MKALTVHNDKIAMFVMAFQILLKLSAALQIELYPFWWCSPIFLGKKGFYTWLHSTHLACICAQACFSLWKSRGKGEC